MSNMKDHRSEMVAYVTECQILAAKQHEVTTRSMELGQKLEKELADVTNDFITAKSHDTATAIRYALQASIVVKAVQSPGDILEKLSLLSRICDTRHVNDLEIDEGFVAVIHDLLEKWF